MRIIKAETDNECEETIKSFARTQETARYLLSLFECQRAIGNGPKESLKAVAIYYAGVLMKTVEEYENSTNR